MNQPATLPTGASQAVDPIDAIAGWPPDLPLAAFLCGPGARWTILASPGAARRIEGPGSLDHALGLTAKPVRGAELPAPDGPPFRSGRLLVLGYDLGKTIEPAARRRSPAPLGCSLDIAGVLAFDRLTGAWSRHGDTDNLPDPPARGADPGFTLGPLTSIPGRAGYVAMVKRALGLIASGDVYQVNLAHRLSASFEGSARSFFAALARSAEPVHGVYAESPMFGAVCSASPELFLRYDTTTRRVTTRPMKGTRPISGDPGELRDAAKDRAELDMITDLMRNDLGRVCAFGSVRVDRSREIEAHGSSVYQATSTISGVLREGLGPAELVRAAFPPGSVTGTPKIRAMQLIDELEPTPRGFYCGALGWLDDAGGLELNVAIRTATITPGDHRELHYHAGAGIVADSDPEAEWAETLDKAEVLRRAVPYLD